MGRLIIHTGYPKVASTFLQRQILDTSQNINGLYGDVGIILAERDDSQFVWFSSRGAERVDKAPGRPD